MRWKRPSVAPPPVPPSARPHWPASPSGWRRWPTRWSPKVAAPLGSIRPLSKATPSPTLIGGGFCPVRATIIPEAILHPRGLSLPGPWSDAHGPHLTYWASVDITAHGHGGPATRPFL